MSKILELKDAIHQLEDDVAALANAKRELENWKEQDRHRRDGSSAQDERHERMGREASERVWQAEQKIHSQKDLIVKITHAI